MAVTAAEPGRPDNSIASQAAQFCLGSREVDAQLIPEVYGELRWLASELLRNILVDCGCARQEGKCGRVQRQVIPSGDALQSGDLAIEVLLPNEVREYRAQRLHFEEIAVISDVSDPIKDDWSMARLWLQGELAKQP